MFLSIAGVRVEKPETEEAKFPSDTREQKWPFLISYNIGRSPLPLHHTPTEIEGLGWRKKKNSFQNGLLAVSIILWVLQTHEERNENLLQGFEM